MVARAAYIRLVTNRYLAPELYQSVVVEVSAQGIRVTDRLTDRIIVDCNITEVAATATRQRSALQQPISLSARSF